MTTKERWAWVETGLMSPYPSNFLLALRRPGALARLLPEVEALFGVPQLSDAALPVDVGQHQLRVLQETARIRAPIQVRFGALMHKIGKGGTPREIWPSHYKYESRGHALLDALPGRIAIPAPVLAFAHMVVDECDRVHRASDKRAGAITELLARLRADRDDERFEQLLCVCTCDYASYAGHAAADYTKASKLRRALAAYRRAVVAGLSEEQALIARAHEVARTLGSFAQRTS
jgi:tRNA nucleotidyltransferase (CCA-adding enzyme)